MKKKFFLAMVLLGRKFRLAVGRTGQNGTIVSIADYNGLAKGKCDKFVGLKGLLSANDENAGTFLGDEGDVVEAQVSVYQGKSINIDLPSQGSDAAPVDL